jgi:hypothetical protein
VHKKYADFEEICYDVQIYMYVTKFNLKKNDYASNDHAIVFICSCSSFKKEKCRQEIHGKNDYIPQENYSDEEKSERLSNSSKTGTICSKINSFSRDNNKLNKISNNVEKSPRQIKRQNILPCRFRLRFKRDKATGLLSLNKNSILKHNHYNPKGFTIQVVIKLNF